MKTYKDCVEFLAEEYYHSDMGGSTNPAHGLSGEINMASYIYTKSRTTIIADMKKIAQKQMKTPKKK